MPTGQTRSSLHWHAAWCSQDAISDLCTGIELSVAPDQPGGTPSPLRVTGCTIGGLLEEKSLQSGFGRSTCSFHGFVWILYALHRMTIDPGFSFFPLLIVKTDSTVMDPSRASASPIWMDLGQIDWRYVHDIILVLFLYYYNQRGLKPPCYNIIILINRSKFLNLNPNPNWVSWNQSWYQPCMAQPPHRKRITKGG